MLMCPLLCPHGFLSPLSSQLIGIKKEIVISPSVRFRYTDPNRGNIEHQ